MDRKIYDEWLDGLASGKHSLRLDEYKKLSQTKNGGIFKEWKSLKKVQGNDKINIEIDEFTPCLRRNKDNKIVDTYFKVGTPTHYKLNGWEFDWSQEESKGYLVSQLFAEGDDRIQGLIATKPNDDVLGIEIDIVESAPFNNPHNKRFKEKEYSGVGGHLFAEAIRQSYERGYGGFIYFVAKTNLIDYYKKELGAVQIGASQKMFIDERNAKRLYERYFKK